MFDRMVEEKLYYDKYLDLLKEDITVDAQSYYDENSDQFDVCPDQVDAQSTSSSNDKETAEDIIKQLDDGVRIFLSSPRNTAPTRRLLSRRRAGIFHR